MGKIKKETNQKENNHTPIQFASLFYQLTWPCMPENTPNLLILGTKD